MSCLNTDLSNEKAGMWHMELPAVCMPVYKCIVEEMAGLIDNEQVQKVFYSFMMGEKIDVVSERTGIAAKKLAYMYKKGVRQVLSEWKSTSEWKRELYAMQIKCRNYESLLNLPQILSEWDFNSIVTVPSQQSIPLEYADLLATPLVKLELNFRSLRALRKYDIYSLEDLLRFIKVNGFDSLYKIPGIGNRSIEHIYARLEEKDILLNKNTCPLFPYLLV